MRTKILATLAACVLTAFATPPLVKWIDESTTTSNMGLVLPTPGVDTGPGWASLINGAFTAIDSHNHTSGQGVQVPTAGLNINADLTLQGNSAYDTNAVEFNALLVHPDGGPMIWVWANPVFPYNEELVYVDSFGNLVFLTNNGQIAVPGLALPDGGASVVMTPLSDGGYTFGPSSVALTLNQYVTANQIGCTPNGGSCTGLTAGGTVTAGAALHISQFGGAYLLKDDAGLLDLLGSDEVTPVPVVTGPITVDGGAIYGAKLGSSGTLRLYNNQTTYNNSSAVGNSYFEATGAHAASFFTSTLPDGGAAVQVGQIQTAYGFSIYPASVREEILMGDGGCVDGVAVTPLPFLSAFSMATCTREGGQFKMADSAQPNDGVTQEQVQMLLTNQDGGGLIVPFSFSGVTGSLPGSGGLNAVPYGSPYTPLGMAGSYQSVNIMLAPTGFPDGGANTISAYTDGGLLAGSLYDTKTGASLCSISLPCVPRNPDGGSPWVIPYQFGCFSSFTGANNQVAFSAGSSVSTPACTVQPIVNYTVEGIYNGFYGTDGGPL